MLAERHFHTGYFRYNYYKLLGLICSMTIRYAQRQKLESETPIASAPAVSQCVSRCTLPLPMAALQAAICLRTDISASRRASSGLTPVCLHPQCWASSR